MTKPDLGEFNVIGWMPPAGDFPERDWLAAVAVIHQEQSRSQWQLGDLWAFGESKYGSRKALTDSPDWRGPSLQTCMHAAVTARAFKTCRRRQVLSFSHHVEVAKLPPDVGDELLSWAERENKSTRELRERAQQWKKDPLAKSKDELKSAISAYAAAKGIVPHTLGKLNRTAKLAPDLAFRVTRGELTVERGWMLARDRVKAIQEATRQGYENATVTRSASASSTGGVVIPMRRGIEEERAHVMKTAELLVSAGRAMRSIADANISAETLLRVVPKGEFFELERNLLTGLKFFRNVVNTWSYLTAIKEKEA